MKHLILMRNLSEQLEHFKIRRTIPRLEQGSTYTGRFRISIPGTVQSNTGLRHANCKVYESEEFRLVKFTIRERKYDTVKRWRGRKPTVLEICRLREMFFNPEDYVVMAMPHKSLQEIKDFEAVELWECFSSTKQIPKNYKLDHKTFKINKE